MEEELNTEGWPEMPGRLATLNGITAALSRSLEVRPALDLIVRGAVDLSAADAGAIYEWGPGGPILVLAATHRVSPAVLQAIHCAHVQPGEGAIGQAVVRRSMVEMVDARQPPDCPGGDEIAAAGYCAVAALPMIRGSEVVGAIALWYRQPPQISPDVRSLLATLADQAAVALGNVKVYEQAQRRASELAALVEVGRDITATLDLPLVLERIANHAWRILESDTCDLYLVEPDGRAMKAIVSLGAYAAETMASPTFVGEGIVGLVAQSGVAEMINDMYTDPRAVQIPGTPDEEAQAMICAPLVSKGRVIGIMALSRFGERRFVQADLDFLVNLAQQAVIAIENARFYEATRLAEAEARYRAELLTALHGVALDISAELGLESLLRAIVRRAVDLLGREAGSLWLYNDATDRLDCVVSMAGWPEYTAIALRPGQGLNGTVFAAGRPIVVEDYWSWEGADAAFVGEPVGPAICVPLAWKGRVRGSLQVSGRIGTPPFVPADVAAVSMLAAQAAIAIENARLYDAAQQRAQELAQALARQQQIDRMQAEFIQNVSHELRTPLTLIQGYAEMLNDEELGPLAPDQAAPVAIITRQVQTLRALVEDIMMIFTVDAQAMQVTCLSVPELLRAAVGDFQALARQSGLVLEADIPPDLPAVAGDVRHLRKVIDNLLANAVKFTPVGGRLVVQAGAENGGVAVRVIDSGIGIPPGELEKVFRRFYQVDGSLRRRYGGTGLGLALVHDILEKHGGWIKAESEGAPGRGSTFTFWLPCA